ncbi:MAG TPA: DUF4259 domain-containing protein [Pseudolysinimonas sp.]|nr:DUF4259 domain-containing protein [Pseudolysinimonas sp.]
MGTWSGEPFGNDGAADWGWELDEAADWQPVRRALNDALDGPLDADVAETAVAAAEVVAHGLGRATQSDAYTTSVAAFVARVGAPPGDLVALAVAALGTATGPDSELTELWNDADPTEWRDANAVLEAALRG